MRGPLNIKLEDFGVSPKYGFLPDEIPLERLDPFYSSWEDVAQMLTTDFEKKTYRSRVDRLPILTTSLLKSEREWRRAYVLLTFMTHGYIWGGRIPSETLPPCLSVPLIAVAKHLEIPPTATVASTCLWNYASSSSELTNVDNLSSLVTFTGSRDEDWFYIVTVAIEARGGALIPIMLAAMDAVIADNPAVVANALLEFSTCVADLIVILERMYEHCAADAFYHRIRPALAGSKNMQAAGLSRGVFYDEGDGKGEWRQCSGGSNAQSSTIQFLDLVLGVKHFPTKSPGEEPREKHSFHQEMRSYMPGGHRRFLELIEKEANIREYAQTSASGEEITSAYNDAVKSLGALRDAHIKMVTRYIVVPSTRTGTQDSIAGINLAVASTGKKDGLSGTGGTQLMPFLKQSRDETTGNSLS